MTQDFAKRKTSAKRSTASRKTSGASRSSTSKKRPSASRTSNNKSSGSEKSALVWFSLGLICGLFISLLIFLAWQSQPQEQTPAPQSSKTETTTKAVTTNSDKNKPSNKEPEFEFYNMLPDDKVVVDNTPKASTKAKKIYYLQASSFASFKQADQVKAKLILQGMDVEIRKSQGSSGKTWYKIVTGPYQTRSKMAAAKSKLVNQGFNPLVLSKKLEQP